MGGFVWQQQISAARELTAAIRWPPPLQNDLQHTTAIIVGSAIQSALVVGPEILLLSRRPFIALPDINLVFGLFILAVFGLIAYVY